MKDSKDKCKETKKTIIFFFTLIIIVNINHLSRNYIKTNKPLDNILPIFGIFLSILTMNPLFDYLSYKVHELYAIYVVAISLFATNKELILISSITLAITILLRLYYNRCILNDNHSEKKKFSKTDFLANLNQYLNWNIIFPALFIISIIRLNY